MRITVLTATLVLCLASISGAQADDENLMRPTLSIVANAVSTPTYNAKGRLVGMVMERFDVMGNIIGSSSSHYDYDRKGRLIGSGQSFFDADNLQRQRHESHWTLDLPGVLRKGERSFYDADDVETRFEKETWRQDPESNILTIQTEYYDADPEVLTRTRYAVTERDSKGRISVRDTSVFSPENVQTERSFEEWIYTSAGRLHKVKTVTFDNHDEIVEKRSRNHRYDDGLLVSLDTEINDSSDLLTGTIHETREYTDGRLQLRIVTHSNAQGITQRRMTESITYDAAGKVRNRRINWEYLQ
jgi:hypothetical protein